jgi:hypothetical protein
MLAGNPATLPAGTADINKNGVGGIISNLFAFVGILLIIYGIWKVVQDIMKGSIGKAVMTAALFGAAGALCLDLNLGITLLSSMKGLVKAIIDTFNNTATGGGTPTVDPTQRV